MTKNINTSFFDFFHLYINVWLGDTYTLILIISFSLKSMFYQVPSTLLYIKYISKTKLLTMYV